MSNRSSYVKLNNSEPYNTVHDIIAKHSPLAKAKMATLNTRNKFIYFIDDLNLNTSCNTHSSSKTFELMRQIMETNAIYSFDEEIFLTLSEFNFVLACSTPRKLIIIYDNN